MVIAKHIRSKNIINFINAFKEQNKTLVLMFHSVVEKPTNKWEYSISSFEKICSYLEEQVAIKNIEVGTFSYFISKERYEHKKELN